MKNKEFYELSLEWITGKHFMETKKSTRTIYMAMLNNHIWPVLGKYRVFEINSALLQSFQDDLVQKSGGRVSETLSPSTISLIRTVLTQVMDTAVEANIIEYNPMIKVKALKKNKHEMRVLSREEQLRLEKAVRYAYDSRSIGVLLSLYCGLRLGEVCALRWQDVDFNGGVINVSNTVSRVSTFNDNSETRTVIEMRSAKTRKSLRQIPVPQFLLAQLKVIKNASIGHFVVNNKADSPMCTRLMTYIFKNLLRLADIIDANFHCLRHTFATRALENGVDFKTIGDILGHSNIGTTMNIYVHCLLDHKREMMSKVSPLGNLAELESVFDASYTNNMNAFLSKVVVSKSNKNFG